MKTASAVTDLLPYSPSYMRDTLCSTSQVRVVYFTNSGTADMAEIMLDKLMIQSWGLSPLTDASYIKLTGIPKGTPDRVPATM